MWIFDQKILKNWNFFQKSHFLKIHIFPKSWKEKNIFVFVVFSVFSLEKRCTNEDACASILWFMRKPKLKIDFLNSHPKSEGPPEKIGSDVLTLIKLIDHDLIWRDEKLHSSIIQDKKSVLERSESRKKLERLLTFSQNFFHNELFKWHLFKKNLHSVLKMIKNVSLEFMYPKMWILKMVAKWDFFSTFKQ